jgi:hypothetical protein
MIKQIFKLTTLFILTIILTQPLLAQKKIILLCSNYDKSSYFIKNNRMVYVQLNNQTTLNGFIKIDNDSMLSINGKHFHKDSIESITTKGYSKGIHLVLIASLGISVALTGISYYYASQESDDQNQPKDEYYATKAGDACLAASASGILGSLVLITSTTFKRKKYFDTKSSFTIKVLKRNE